MLRGFTRRIWLSVIHAAAGGDGDDDDVAVDRRFNTLMFYSTALQM